MSRRRKRLFLALAAASLVALMLAACGSGGAGYTPPPATQVQPEATVLPGTGTPAPTAAETMVSPPSATETAQSYPPLGTPEATIGSTAYPAPTQAPSG